MAGPGWLAVALALNGAQFSRESPCDRPGNDLGGKDQSSREESADKCEERCAGVERCEAYVYISGWGRCFLKGKAGKAIPVRFYAGTMKDGAVAAAGFDLDNSGKDLRRVEHVASGEACGAQCAAEPKCKAFAWIGGYGDCWLKQAAGNQKEKVFSCGVKKH